MIGWRLAGRFVRPAANYVQTACRLWRPRCVATGAAASCRQHSGCADTSASASTPTPTPTPSASSRTLLTRNFNQNILIELKLISQIHSLAARPTLNGSQSASSLLTGPKHSRWLGARTMSHMHDDLYVWPRFARADGFAHWPSRWLRARLICEPPAFRWLLVAHEQTTAIRSGPSGANWHAGRSRRCWSTGWPAEVTPAKVD